MFLEVVTASIRCYSRWNYRFQDLIQLRKQLFHLKMLQMPKDWQKENFLRHWDCNRDPFTLLLPFLLIESFERNPFIVHYSNIRKIIWQKVECRILFRSVLGRNLTIFETYLRILQLSLFECFVWALPSDSHHECVYSLHSRLLLHCKSLLALIQPHAAISILGPLGCKEREN